VQPLRLIPSSKAWRGVEQSGLARLVHTHEVGGSNPPPATNFRSNDGDANEVTPITKSV
jgi:hypothetical protein